MPTARFRWIGLTALTWGLPLRGRRLDCSCFPFCIADRFGFGVGLQLELIRCKLAHIALLRADLGARSSVDDAVDNDLVVCGNPAPHHSEPFGFRPKFHRFDHHDIVFIDDQQILLTLIRSDSSVTDKES